MTTANKAAMTRPKVPGKPYRKVGAMVCGKITIGSHAATAYWKPFMLLMTMALSSLSDAQTSFAQV